MQDFSSVFLSNEFLMVYSLVGIMALIVLIAFIVDRKPKKRPELKEQPEIQDAKEETIIEIEDKSTEITELDQLLEPTKQQEVMQETIEEVSPKEEIKYVDEAQEKTMAQETLQRLTEELKQQEQEPANIELTDFELEQENTAIISLDELMKKADAIYQENEVVQYEDEGNEPINLEELEARFKAQEEKEVVTLSDFNTVPVQTEPAVIEEKKFKNSPVISPVYGIEKEQSEETAIELENTANYEKLDEEIRKTNEFLQTLRELKKKLG